MTMPYAKKSQEPPPSHEIIIGLVAGVGTNLKLVSKKLAARFNKTNNYLTREVRVTNLLNYLSKEYSISSGNQVDKILDRIKKCNNFREKIQAKEAMAILALAEIKKLRNSLKKTNAVYIVNQIKNPSEVKLFRKIYGKNFMLISVYEHKDERKKHLLSWWKTKRKKEQINELISIDEKEGTTYGQDMREAFVEADYFIDMSKLDENIERLTKILLGYPYHTPTKDEINMAYAWIASTRSADMSRQVGSAIATEEGDSISLGCNEVPKYKGGFFWENDIPDYRDFNIGFDANHALKNKLIKDTISLISPESNQEEKFKSLKQERAEILDIIEFCRAVHAEDAAICDAARRGICIAGATLYCTTFPCHLCTKHIIAVGIKKVVYIYPYDKSRAKGLYDDIISINPNGTEEKVIFSHFMGVAPRKILKAFTNIDNRKDKDGNKIEWNLNGSISPFLSDRTPLAYFDKEVAYLWNAYNKILSLIATEDFKSIFNDAKLEYEAMSDEKKYWVSIEV